MQIFKFVNNNKFHNSYCHKEIMKTSTQSSQLFKDSNLKFTNTRIFLNYLWHKTDFANIENREKNRVIEPELLSQYFILLFVLILLLTVSSISSHNKNFILILNTCTKIHIITHHLDDAYILECRTFMIVSEIKIICHLKKIYIY